MGFGESSANINADVYLSGNEPSTEYDGILSAIFRRELTEMEFLYLLSRYPYISLDNEDVSSYLYESPKKLILKESPWTIIDFHHRLLCVPGEVHGTIDGGGTLEGQGFATMRALLKEIKKREWGAINVGEGSTEYLARYVWILGQQGQIPVLGYAPSAVAEVMLKKHQSLKQFGTVEHLLSQGNRPSGVSSSNGIADLDDGY